jgi:hypothetical protein
MHSIARLKTFETAARQAGMTEDEIEELEQYLAANPEAGDQIVGTGGCRKLRWARPGMGKRGGYRTITFYSGDDLPVFLVTVFSKGERADLTSKERSALKAMTKTLIVEYAKKVRKVGTR